MPDGDSKSRLNAWGNEIPPEVLEQIFSHMSPSDLCACAQVCWNWNNLSSQNLIWKPHLDRDSQAWTTLSNEKAKDINTLGGILENEDTICKYTYLMSMPNLERTGRSLSFYKRFTSSRRRYKVAFFGSGLELPGFKRVADSILNPTAASPFIADGLHSGNAGSGSGVCVKLFGINYIICFLYSNRKEVREQRNGMEPYSSLLFEEHTAEDAENEDNSLTVKKDIANTLREMDGLVYVVNAESDRNAHLIDKKDFYALQEVCNPKVPLVVMASIPCFSQKRLTCSQLCEALELNRVKRPWLIQNIIESSLSGVPEALDWIMRKAK